jgi:hypothetical protein
LHRYLVTSSAQPAHEFRNHGNAGLAGRLFPGYRDAHITNLMHTDSSEFRCAIAPVDSDKSAWGQRTLTSIEWYPVAPSGIGGTTSAV